MKNVKKDSLMTPFHKRLIVVGFFLSVVTLIIDVPWPVVSFLGVSTHVGVFVFGGALLLSFIGMVLGIVAGVAARKGAAAQAAAATAAINNGATTVTPSPGGTTATPAP